MFLHVALGIQLVLSIVMMPNDVIIVKELKDKTHTTMDSGKPSGDDLTTMIQRYTTYNHWANQQLADWLRSASEEDMNLKIESSFSSLKETVIHIWNAEYLWLQIVNDEPADNSPAKNFEGSKDELLELSLIHI